MAQHKWAKEIKAWADGQEIEKWMPFSEIWERVDYPQWNGNEDYKFRIKPQPKEPQYLYVYKDRIGLFGLSQTKEHKDITYVGKIKLEQGDEQL